MIASNTEKWHCFEDKEIDVVTGTQRKQLDCGGTSEGKQRNIQSVMVMLQIKYSSSRGWVDG